MDLVLVGLPGSGKSVVGRRIAHRHDATFIDLDEAVETAAGRSIPEIFAADGEDAFRDRERAAIAGLGPPDRDSRLRRVIATGGGAVVDARNRWLLYRGRRTVWLDARPEALAQRLRRSRTMRPLVAAGDPIGALRGLGAARARFYAPARRINALAEPASVAAAIEAVLAEPALTDGGCLLVAETRIGRFTVGDGIVGEAAIEALGRLGASRAIVVSEPVVWAILGPSLAAAFRETGLTLELIELPSGEAAKRLAVIEQAGRELARIRAERREPIVALGGGALGDTAGLLAALWLRGVPLIHLPTTLVGQIDSAIGGKAAVDLPEGKNLIGAFHQPSEVIVDTRLTRSLPERERRAALGEAVKMAALGDDRLFELLDRDGAAIAAGSEATYASGVVAEVVERCLWAKVEIVLSDEHEHGGPDGRPGRLALNLGHSAGHALEAADGYASLRHGEAVAAGLRVACRIGRQIGSTPPERAARIERLLDRLEIARDPVALPLSRVLDALAGDKKHAGGRLRWVVPTAGGVEVRLDVPDDVVREAIGSILAGPSSPGEGLISTPAAAR